MHIALLKLAFSPQRVAKKTCARQNHERTPYIYIYIYIRYICTRSNPWAFNARLGSMDPGPQALGCRRRRARREIDSQICVYITLGGDLAWWIPRSAFRDPNRDFNRNSFDNVF